jgi:hypothetical protein
MAADVTREDGFKNRGTIAEARTREAPTHQVSIATAEKNLQKWPNAGKTYANRLRAASGLRDQQAIWGKEFHFHSAITGKSKHATRCSPG